MVEPISMLALGGLAYTAIKRWTKKDEPPTAYAAPPPTWPVDAAEARRIAPLVAQDYERYLGLYDQPLMIAFKTAAGLRTRTGAVDPLYSGRVMGALAYFGVPDPPPVLPGKQPAALVRYVMPVNPSPGILASQKITRFMAAVPSGYAPSVQTAPGRTETAGHAERVGANAGAVANDPLMAFESSFRSGSPTPAPATPSAPQTAESLLAALRSGAATQAQITSYQMQMGLPVSGIMDATTIAFIGGVQPTPAPTSKLVTGPRLVGGAGGLGSAP